MTKEPHLYITCRDCIVYVWKRKIIKWDFTGNRQVLQQFQSVSFARCVSYAQSSNVALISVRSMHHDYTFYRVCRSTGTITDICTDLLEGKVYGQRGHQLFLSSGVYNLHRKAYHARVSSALIWNQDLSVAYQLNYSISTCVLDGCTIRHVKNNDTNLRWCDLEQKHVGLMSFMYESEDRAVFKEEKYLLVFQDDKCLTNLPTDLDRLVQSYLSLRYTAKGRWCRNTMRKINLTRAVKRRDKALAELAAAEKEVMRYSTPS